MYELDIERDFSAAHSLCGYNGNCSSLHGHNWTVQAFVRAANLDKIGIAVDFKKLKKELDTILEELDHTHLNELTDFRSVNPTSEVLSKYIFEKLSSKINDGNVKVFRVRVCESSTSGASYYAD